MRSHRNWIVFAAFCCFFAGLGPAIGQGQVPELPRSIAPPDRPLAHDSAPGPPDGQEDQWDVPFDRTEFFEDPWVWQVFPEGLLYRAYLAGGRESRFASHWMHEQDEGWLIDAALGAHVGLLRYGSRDVFRPEGWQLDVEAAAFPRLTLDEDRDLVSADFRYGLPLTFRRGLVETKFSYYHLSSHLGDEYMLTHPSIPRINYVRDALVAGLALRPYEDLRLYAEAGWAFHVDGGSKPWEFQFGVDYSPMRPTGSWPDPFLAVNGRIREEVDFGGNLTVQTGLQWRNQTGRLFRLGLHYFNGKTDQYQFFRVHEEQIGLGAWYDF